MVDGRDSAWRNRAPGPHALRNTVRQMDGLWTEARGQQKQSNAPPQQSAQPQYANYWAPLTRKRHTTPHSAQPQHTNYWAPRTWKRHQQEHRPQRPTESSDPTHHAKGRTGDCPGPRKGTTTRRNVTQGGGGGGALDAVYARRVHEGNRRKPGRSPERIPPSCVFKTLGVLCRIHTAKKQAGPSPPLTPKVPGSSTEIKHPPCTPRRHSLRSCHAVCLL